MGVVSNATSFICVNEGNLNPQFLHLTISLVNKQYDGGKYIKIVEDE
jgi:hypothetical protein